MQSIKAMRLVGAAFMLAASIGGSAGAHAQSSYAASSVPASNAKASKAASKAADRALQKSVLRALSKTRGLRVASITVRASEGAVILEGTVPEEAQIGLATQVAEGVEGVKSVKNALTLSTI
ncbi:BON domain-containing protein [Caballeronia sp. GAFFF2]|uniref:BON domain-containing protein n=1 Tax=Caballeronia sp. GAFFF2 TaxID=2921741 RepID=UPI002027BF0B|nr:BON domain-containing protein [Caballeronia sp. GAFFF2]